MNSKLMYGIFFGVFFIIYLLHSLLSGQGVYGDGNAYYSYTQAVYFERGLNFEPIYEHLANFQGKKNVFNRLPWDTHNQPPDSTYNPYLPGAGILWIVPVAILKLISTLFGLSLNKFSLAYEIAAGTSGIFFIVGGIYFLEKYLGNFFKNRKVVLSVIIFLLASNLLYYAALEPALAHQPIFFFLSFLLYKTYKMKPNFFNFFSIGIFSGFFLITRFPDAVLLIIPAVQLLKTSKVGRRGVIVAVMSFLFPLTILLLVQNFLYGNAFHNPYFGGESGFFKLTIVNFLDFFLSPKRGLFLWSPIYVLCLIGLFKRRPTFLGPIGLLFIICAFWSGNTSAGYGQRLVIGAAPLFIFGLTALFANISTRKAIILSLPFILWNFLTLFQFYFDSSNLVKNNDLTTQYFLRGQISAPIRALRLIRSSGVKDVFYKYVLD